MKKALKTISASALVCLLLIGSCLTVFAAPSPTDTVTIETDAEYTVEDITLTQEIANQLAGEEVAILGQWDMDVNPQTPVSFTVAGTEDLTLYCYHFYDGEWHVEANGPGTTLTVTFAHGSPVALAVSTPKGSVVPNPSDPAAAQKGTAAKAPKTGETSGYLMFAGLTAITVGIVAITATTRKRSTR